MVLYKDTETIGGKWLRMEKKAIVKKFGLLSTVAPTRVIGNG